MTRSALFLAALLAATPLGAHAAAAQTTAAPAANSADARLRALYTEEWTWRQKEFGQVEGPDGSSQSADYLPRVDPASQAARLAYWTRVLAELDRIPTAQLSDEEKINAAVFRTMIEEDAGEIRYKTYEAPFNSDTFFWTWLAPRGGFRTAAEYESYLKRLGQVPRYFNEQVANMQSGLKRGFSVPRVTLAGRDKTIEPYLATDDSNPLYAPFKAMPSSISAAEQARLRAAGTAAIRDSAVPAYAKLLAFLRDDYFRNARTSLGASEMPDGKAYYQAMIRKFTTLDLTGEQIHQIGLKEVDRITAEMEETRKRAGFKGSLAEFIVFLRTDPQFYAKTPRELLSYSAYVVKKADEQLGETIGLLPRYRHGIIPVPDAIAPIYTAGRGGLENCMMNTYNLPARPLYAIPALTLHECTPGHSFQAALALEAPARPSFRKEIYFSGYGEGWGLYTEWLGTVMGVYETPYEDFGRLTYEMWRAARLVIDTGIHQYGWSRDKAIDYLKSHTALSEHEINTEIDRYTSWPGQAVAYKLGELQIRRLRKEAEEKLGAGFDQRYFHDTILALGSVPLPVMESEVRKWIAGGGKNPNARP